MEDFFMSDEGFYLREPTNVTGNLVSAGFYPRIEQQAASRLDYHAE